LLSYPQSKPSKSKVNLSAILPTPDQSTVAQVPNLIVQPESSPPSTTLPNENMESNHSKFELHSTAIPIWDKPKLAHVVTTHTIEKPGSSQPSTPMPNENQESTSSKSDVISTNTLIPDKSEVMQLLQ
jgi:hypothetical protein